MNSWYVHKHTLIYVKAQKSEWAWCLTDLENVGVLHRVSHCGIKLSATLKSSHRFCWNAQEIKPGTCTLLKLWPDLQKDVFHMHPMYQLYDYYLKIWTNYLLEILPEGSPSIRTLRSGEIFRLACFLIMVLQVGLVGCVRRTPFHKSGHNLEHSEKAVIKNCCQWTQLSQFESR